MIRGFFAVVLALTLGLAVMPAMARVVPPAPTQTMCDKTESIIEQSAAEAFVPGPDRVANLTARLDACPGLRESLSAAAQAWLTEHGI